MFGISNVPWGITTIFEALNLSSKILLYFGIVTATIFADKIILVSILPMQLYASSDILFFAKLFVIEDNTPGLSLTSKRKYRDFEYLFF